MKSILKIISVVTLGFIAACASDFKPDLPSEYPEKIDITFKNVSEIVRADEIILLNVAQMKARASNFNPTAFIAFCEGVEVVCQNADTNRDGKIDQIFVRLDFEPGEKKTVQFHYATSGVKIREHPKRTQAELSIKVGGKFVNRKYEGGAFQNVQFLRVPPEHTDHSFFIRYEGPGWESDKVGYRFYLDWRNAIDIFGKKTPHLVLQNVGQDGFESYHAMSDWGMDVLKVGESLGIGSIGMWRQNQAHRVNQTDSVTCEIVANGALQSCLQTKYFGWKIGKGSYRLISNLSIDAGSRLTKHVLEIDDNPDNLCTGLIKLPGTKVLQSAGRSEKWCYFATYGEQSLANDHLGMAILYRQKDLLEITEDEQSHVIVLKPRHGHLTYFFLAAWAQEPDGIQSLTQFRKYLEQTITRLNHPIRIYE
ncbi:DUF4861 domain-containing protein [candidate division KSB1 bacterium]|nr:DUF4861 domain-containing protein [candidate division KSB1 bacterium]